MWKRVGSLLFVVMLPAVAALSQDPSLILADGGIQFPDGTVQETSAVVTDPPPTLTVPVDCAAGDSINEALRQPAEELTIEISGICTENVVVSRSNVTLIGTDPSTDGIQGASGIPINNAVLVFGTFSVTIENLQLTGAVGGLGVDYAFAVRVINCRLENNSYAGAFLSGANVRFEDTVITGNGRRGVRMSQASFLNCIRCTIENNPAAGERTGIQAFNGSHIYLSDSIVEGATGIDTTASKVEAWGGSGEIKGAATAIRAVDNASVRLGSISLTGALFVEVKSSAVLENTTQTMPGGSTAYNEIAVDSSLVVVGTASLAADVEFQAFATGVFYEGTSVSGSLECYTGSDAACEDPSDITGTSDCALCPKP